MKKVDRGDQASRYDIKNIPEKVREMISRDLSTFGSQDSFNPETSPGTTELRRLLLPGARAAVRSVKLYRI